MTDTNLRGLRVGDASTALDIQGREVVEPKDWRLKAIDPATIKNARRAARMSGLRIGAWVARAINQAASSELSVEGGIPISNCERQSVQELRDQLTLLEAKVDRDSHQTEQRIREVQDAIKTITFSMLRSFEDRKNSIPQSPLAST